MSNLRTAICNAKYEEDEAGPNTPFYLPHSFIDLQFLVSLDNAVQEVLLAVVEHIERLMKEGLGDEDEDSVMKMVGDDKVVTERK
ncbi:hypothetical protein BDR04DRAFT_1160688 [Suillus decipiens]|nr:hypothetical protein BDR04DRAFT_1160688 [Suillus decipiens]